MRWFLVHASGLALATGQLAAQDSRVHALTPAVLREVEAVFAGYHDSTPGYGVGIIQDGKLVYARGFGSANLEYRAPITPASVFNVASLSKQFTAAAIALLAFDGRLSLDDKVGKYVSEWPRAYQDVRIKHLIYMTSGLPEYYRQPRSGGRTWDRDYFTVDDAIAASLARGRLEFEPGSAWAYSNVNYMVLTKIIAQVSGQSFAEFTRKSIFEPLGMTSTHFNDDVTRVVPNRVSGYNIRDGGGYQRHDRISPHYGGSGLFTTLTDLARWDNSFYRHALRGPRLTEMLLDTMRFQHNKVNDAFGLVWGEYRGHKTLWYEGGDLGFSSYMVRFPDMRLSVIVLSNLGTGNAAQKARQVLDVIFQH